MKKLLFVLVLSSLSINLSGQRTYRKFATQYNYNRLLTKYPEMAQARKKLEQFTSEHRKRGQPAKVIIPVVFHVLYTNSEEQISEQQILNQLAALNRDFDNRTTRDNHPAYTLQGFNKKARSMEIEFCLATSSISSSAISYQRTEQKQWRVNDQMKSSNKGGADPVDTDRYLNVWVCNLGGELGGYSQLPGGPTATDGIVIDYRYVGPNNEGPGPYRQGKTLTHLVGSYLNLLELWSNRGKCLDDKVADTPIHNGPNYECPSYKHVSTCSGNPVEMTMNFMDYTDDACMYMFTNGQMWRMHATLAKGGPRHGLTRGQAQCDNQRSMLELANEKLDDSNSLQHSLQYRVYPNPAESSDAVLEITSEEMRLSTIEIYDSFGKRIQSFDWELEQGTQNYSLEIGNWPTGLYLIQIRIGQFQHGLKLIVNRK